METNLMSFFPDVQLVNVSEMLKTNGLKCLVGGAVPLWSSDIPTLDPSGCSIFVYNYSTTGNVGCLRMPATNLCRIILLDKQGHKVKKTALGMMYGWPLSQEQIEDWRHHWHNSHQRMLVSINAMGSPKPYYDAIEMCHFSLKDAFEIKKAGEYELHVQLRLIQVGKDSSGKIYYPVTWLPEVVAKIHIRPEDIAE